MWIPKTKEELEKQKIVPDKLSIKYILLGVVGTYLFFLIKILLHDLIRYGELSINKDTLITAFIVPIVAIIFYKFISLFHKTDRTKESVKSKDITVICKKCNKVKKYDNTDNCDCGGEFELLSNMKWID